MLPLHCFRSFGTIELCVFETRCKNRNGIREYHIVWIRPAEHAPGVKAWMRLQEVLEPDGSVNGMQPSIKLKKMQELSGGGY